MSRIIEVCCNGASAAGLKNPLILEYSPLSVRRNVRLALPRFVSNLVHIPPRTLDLLELAVFIYAADRQSSRGSREAVEFHSWSRRFRIRMRVRDAEFWNRPEVQGALRACLTFMTGDADFSFVFTGGHSTPPTSLFDRPDTAFPMPNGNQDVALFSGGLDSLSGAIDTLTKSAASLILVGHHSQPGTKQVQRELTKALQARFPGRAALYGFECSLSGVRASEETQRSRTFLYAAMGFAVTQAFGGSALTIYENGVTSMNLRRREDLANARASRTTHPRALSAVQKVLSFVTDGVFEIRTPAFWMTKAEVVERLVALGHGELIASSVSCSRTFQREGAATHCGRCFQCVDRRLAVLAGGHEILDDASLYSVDIMRDSIPEPEARTTVVDYMRQAAQFVDGSDDAFNSEYMSELADALDALPTEGTDLERISRLWELMRGHGESVRRGLQRARALYDDPLAQLPADSLPNLVATREHLRPAVHLLAKAISTIVVNAVGELFRLKGPADEPDLNSKLAALIGSHRQDLISEHPTVPFACARVVPDHALVGSSLLVEAKFIRDGTPPSKVSEGIAADLTKYPEGSHKLFLVYDPHRRISNDVTFRHAFERKGDCTVTIVR